MTERADKPEMMQEYTDYTLDMFSRSVGRDHAEIRQFAKWRKLVEGADSYTFEVPHLAAQRPNVSVRRESGEEFDLISFASYNYLGYSYHPEVLAAAREALDFTASAPPDHHF